MKKKKIIFILVFACVFLTCSNFSLIHVHAESDDNADWDTRNYYTYDYWGNVMQSAPAYKFKSEISYKDFGLGSDSRFAGAHYFNQKFYIVDSGVHRVYVIDKNGTLIQTLGQFTRDGENDSLNKPESVFVDQKENIYVADTGNSRIVIFDANYQLSQIINKPDHLALESLVFNPVDIAVSELGKIYVIGNNVYFGIMELEMDGTFNRFVGTNPVKVSVIETFWRKILSSEQRDYSNLVLPQDFRSIDIDDKGFIYATAFTTSNPIKRINTRGGDVLYRNGYFPPVGDVDKKIAASELISISATDHGIYAVLDRNQGRIFVYNNDGEMIYMFGGLERQDSYFQQPVSICWMDNDEMLVVDSKRSALVVFEPTEFGKVINRATRYHYDGLFEEALEDWKLTLKYNSNYDLAYIGIGKTHFYSNEYEEAMQYFRIGNSKLYYSEAYKLYRAEQLRANFGIIGLVVLAGVAFLASKAIIKRRKNRIKGEDKDETEF